jgi:excisionase family DNA binding protein
MGTVAVISPDELAAVVEQAVRGALRDLGTSEPLATVSDAARRLGLSPRTIRRRIKGGEIPCVRVGRSVRVDLRCFNVAPASRTGDASQGGAKA